MVLNYKWITEDCSFSADLSTSSDSGPTAGVSTAASTSEATSREMEAPAAKRRREEESSPIPPPSN